MIKGRWFFHRPGRNAQGSNAQRDVGADPSACPIDKYRRPILRKEGIPFAGRFYPVGANKDNLFSGWAPKRWVSKPVLGKLQIFLDDKLILH